MNWIGHIIFAFFITLILLGTYTYITKTAITNEFIVVSLTFIVSAIIGSIVPDLDSPSSLFFRIFELIIAAIIAWFAIQTLGFIISALLLALGVFVIFRLLASLIIPRHRGFVHSLMFMLILAISLYFFISNIVIVAGFIVGFWSHLLGDGIPFKVF